MNTPTIVASVLLASGAASVITLLARPSNEIPPDPAALAARAEVADLLIQIKALEDKLADVASAPLPSTSAPQRVEVPTLSNEQVAIAVEAYLRERSAAGAIPTSIDGKPLDLEEVHAGLFGTSYWENTDAWKKAFEEGRMDELIAKFEADAEAFPGDIDKQMALASAYMAYLQMDQSKWQLSMKADEAFDNVLAIDERHWEARFTKAMSYTFWPEFLGKGKEAITHFETLIEQQEGEPAQEHHAQTYLFLGNLLESKDPKRALEMWKRGAARHPSSAELRAKIN